MVLTIISVILLLLGLGGMTGTVTWILMRGNNNRMTRLFITCDGAVILWLVSQLMILFSVTRQQLWVSYIIGNIGISIFSPFWLMFSAEYSDASPKVKKAMLFMPFVSVASMVCVLTNSMHRLYYMQFEKGAIIYGKLFYLFQLLYYVFVLTGICMIFIKNSRQSSRMAGQSTLLALSTAVPLFINTLTVTKIINARIEITPLFFAFSVMMILLAISRYGFLNINRIAINDTINNINSAVAVFDSNDIMTYKNRYAENFIPTDVGSSFTELVNRTNELTGRSFHGIHDSAELEYNGRFYNIRQNFCTNKKGERIARILIINDVSEYYELLSTEKKLSLEQERNRIAQEIHDSAGHTFTMISSLSRIISAELADKGISGETMEHISEIDGLSRSGVTQLRCSINNLREDEFMTSVTRAVNTVTSAVRGVDIDVCTQGTEDESFAFCIKDVYDNVRETITNAMRYSGADRIDVIIRFMDDRLDLYIFDNGKGCSEINENNGLRGIRARTEALGGTVKFSSVEGEGFTTKMSIPKQFIMHNA